VEGDELAPVARRRAADREADEVDGEEAAAADHVRGAERERAGGHRRDRREGADRVREPREDPDRGRPERDADQQPEADLLDDEDQEVVDPVRVRLLDPGDQAERQRDSHRVVAARLGLERACQRAPDVRGAEGCEDRRRVGRCDDGAEKHRFQPGEIEEDVRRDAREQSADDDADRAQKRCGHGDLPQATPRGLEPALVEDQRQPDHSHSPGELRVLELDPARSFRPEQHPEGEERHEDRQTGAGGA
jgi:hypothetical protein